MNWREAEYRECADKNEKRSRVIAVEKESCRSLYGYTVSTSVHRSFVKDLDWPVEDRAELITFCAIQQEPHRRMALPQETGVGKRLRRRIRRRNVAPSWDPFWHALPHRC